MRESDAADARRVAGRSKIRAVLKDSSAASAGTDNRQKIRARSGDRQTINTRRRADRDDRRDRNRLRRTENSRVENDRVGTRRRIRVQHRLTQTARARIIRVRYGKCCRFCGKSETA